MVSGCSFCPDHFSDHKHLDQSGISYSSRDVDHMRTDAAFRFIFASLVILGLGIPPINASVPDDNRQAGITGTRPELNITGADIANQSIPSRYGIPPTLIDVKVEISDTPLPGPKGEMAAGPRTIGFTADPIALVILVTAIVALSAGAWYLVRRNAEDTKDDDEESGE